MNKFFKLLTGITICILLSLLLSISICAAGNFTISLGNTESQPGGIVVVPISMVNAPNFFVSTIEIKYDDDSMTLLNVKDTGLVNGDEHSDKYGSPYTLTWVNNGESVSDGVVAELTFKISTDVEDDSHISISIPRDGMIDIGGANLRPQIDGGIIYIVEEHEHDYGRWTEFSSVKHKRECDCGEAEYERHSWNNGEITEEPTEDTTGELTYTCDVCRATKTSIIPALEPEGYTISGKTTSSDSSISTTIGDTVTITLTNAENKYSTTIVSSGMNNTVNYRIEGVASGRYTLTVSKNKHATREYIVTVSDANVTLDLQINLVGDLDGNGKVNTRDWNAVRDHINKSSVISDAYIFTCADIDGNGKVNTRDWNAIRDHINKSVPLW